MTKLLVIAFLTLTYSSLHTPTEQKTISVDSYTARITYYSNDSIWGNKVACQKAKVAKEGITIAAHPNFKFGTKVFIPDLKDKLGDGVFTVQDRGPAVTKKKASRGKTYVFDVYLANNNKINRFAHSRPEYMKVYVVEP